MMRARLRRASASGSLEEAQDIPSFGVAFLRCLERLLHVELSERLLVEADELRVLLELCRPPVAKRSSQRSARRMPSLRRVPQRSAHHLRLLAISLDGARGSFRRRGSERRRGLDNRRRERPVDAEWRPHA
jgi:hypothetical protein